MPEGSYSMFSLYLRNKKYQTKAAMAIEARIRQDADVNPQINVTSRALAMKTHPTNIGKGIEKQIDPKKPENEWKGVKYGVETLYDEIPQIKTVLNIHAIALTVPPKAFHDIQWILLLRCSCPSAQQCPCKHGRCIRLAGQ